MGAGGGPRTATGAEIKLAYRKLALKHHPDKNVGNEGATAIFQRLQEANSVLSDKQERAWYDSHRDEILRGNDCGSDEEEDDGSSGGRGGKRGGVGGKKRGKSVYVVNIWPFFSGTAFSGYGEGEEGFYAVYRGLFVKIDAHEREKGMPAPPAARGGGAVGGEGEAPEFGGLETGWREVAAFYGYWGDFCSRLSFGWADEYREQDATSRQARRAMEKENRKSREAARKKYQEAIRALVEFVKKRDKRVMQRQVEVGREEAARVAAEVEGAKLKAEEFKKEKERWLKEQTQLWEEEEGARREEEGMGGTAAFRLADEEEDMSSSSSEGEDEGKEGRSRRWKPRKGKKKKKNGGSFECVVCDKKFKSEKQLLNHKQSRAHKRMVEELQAEFGDLEGLNEEKREGEEEEEEEEENEVIFECMVCAKVFVSEKQLNTHKRCRAHGKMVEELQAELEDLEGLKEKEELDEEGEEGVHEEGEGEEEEEVVSVRGDTFAEGGQGSKGSRDKGEGEEQEEDESEEEAEKDVQDEDEEDEEEESSSDDDVGYAARQVNRFSFVDDSSSEED